MKREMKARWAVNTHRDQKGEVKRVRRELYEWSTNHQDKPPTAHLVFKVDGAVGKDELNQWRGFTVSPDSGRDRLHQTLDFIFEVICAGEQYKYDYLHKLLPVVVQHPNWPLETALVLRSDARGPGKGTLDYLMSYLFGSEVHALSTNEQERVFGRFADNRFIRWLHLDEMVFHGNNALMDRLDGLITSPMRLIEIKNKQTIIKVPNYYATMISSNHEFVVRAGEEERRYAIFDVSKRYVKNKPYFKSLRLNYEAGGAAQYLHHLLTQDITDFNHREALPTKEGMRHRIASASVTIKFLVSLTYTGQLICRGDSPQPLPPDGQRLFMPTSKLLACIQEFAQSHKEWPPQDVAAGRDLTAILGPSKEAPKVLKLERAKGYELLSIDELRDKLREVKGLSL
jgi:hypothetical protein